MNVREHKRLYRDIGIRVAEVRKRRGLNQEELSEKAGVSARLVSDVERGEPSRMETYHAIARALDVETLYFVPSTPSAPDPMGLYSDESREMVLMDLRKAIAPPLGANSARIDEPLDLSRVQKGVDAMGAALLEDRYDFLHQIAPEIIRTATYHSDALFGEQRYTALRLRADALQLAARYLIQIREHDLATIAIRDAYRDAAASGASSLAAIITTVETVIMLRQARFREIEDVCVSVADRLEPRHQSPSPDELSAWGRPLLRAAAAAARNNRPKEADEYLAVACRAAEQMQGDQMAVGYFSFGALTAGILGPEASLMAGQPQRALDQTEELYGKSQGIGAISLPAWHKHKLYVADALCMTGQYEKSTELLQQLKLSAPQWFRNERLARDIVRKLLKSRKRTYLDTQRDLADFLALEL